MTKSLKSVIAWEKSKNNLKQESPEPENKKRIRLISRIVIAILATLMVALAIIGTFTPVLDTGSGLIKGKQVHLFEFFFTEDIRSSDSWEVLKYGFGTLLGTFIFGAIYLLAAIPLIIKMFIDIKKDRNYAFILDVTFIIIANLLLIYTSWIGVTVSSLDGYCKVEPDFMINYPQYFPNLETHPQAIFYFAVGDGLVYGTLSLSLAILLIGVVNLLIREKGFFGKYKYLNLNTFLYFIATFALCVITWIIVLNFNMLEIVDLLGTILDKAGRADLLGASDISAELITTAVITVGGVFVVVVAATATTVLSFKEILFYGTTSDATLDQAKEYKPIVTSAGGGIMGLVGAIASLVCAFILSNKYKYDITFNYLLIAVLFSSLASMVACILFCKIEIIK